MRDNPPLLDYPRAAERLATSPRHLRRLVQERRIPHVKVGRFVRFDPADLDAWVQENRRDSAR